MSGAFFAASEPWGFILFARNVESPAQLRRLTSELRDSVGRDAPVLIDQEGGRVAAHARAGLAGVAAGARRLPATCRRTICGSGRSRAALPPDRRRAARRRHQRRLRAGARRARPDDHEIIGDRAYGDEPDEVAAVGRAAAEGLIAGGVLPVMKHIPGHGRAAIDSHLDLPRGDGRAGGARRRRLRAVPGAAPTCRWR